MTDIDAQHFRDVLGHYPTGVSVITAFAADGQALAMVVGTFTSVSLDPPLIGFLPTKTSSSFAELREASRFVVNILAHDQEDVVRRLARSDRTKMNAEQWDLSPAGNPMLHGVVAAIDCDLHSVLEAGDHYIVLGRVQHLQTVRPTTPLLFFRGGYGEFSPKSLVIPDGRGLSTAVSRAQALREDLERAASALGGELTVFARIASDSVAVASAAPHGGDQITPLGIRYPIVPPIGAQYVAWSDAAEQDRWVEKAVGITDIERAAYREHLEDARRWGWSVSLVPDEEADWPRLLTDDALGNLARGRHDQIAKLLAQSARAVDIDSLDPSAHHRVIGFMAPIFVVDGAAPELMVRLLIYPATRMTGDEIRARGAALKEFASTAANTLRSALVEPASATR